VLASSSASRARQALAGTEHLRSIPSIILSRVAALTARIRKPITTSFNSTLNPRWRPLLGGLTLFTIQQDVVELMPHSVLRTRHYIADAGKLADLSEFRAQAKFGLCQLLTRRKPVPSRSAGFASRIKVIEKTERESEAGWFGDIGCGPWFSEGSPLPRSKVAEDLVVSLVGLIRIHNDAYRIVRYLRSLNKTMR